MGLGKCLEFVERDKKWFEKYLPDMKRIWGYVEFLRENKNILDLFCDFIDTKKMKINKTIMKMLDELCNVDRVDYEDFINKLREEVNQKKMQISIMVETGELVKKKNTIKRVTSRQVNVQTESQECMFVDDDCDYNVGGGCMFVEDVEPVKKIFKKKPVEEKNDNNECMFVNDDEPVRKVIKKNLEEKNDDCMFVEDEPVRKIIKKSPIEKNDDCMFVEDEPVKKIIKKEPVKKVIKKSPIENNDVCMFVEDEPVKKIIKKKVIKKN